MANTTKKTSDEKESHTENKNLEKENEKLEKENNNLQFQIDELRKLIEGLKNSEPVEKSKGIDNIEEDIVPEIPLNKTVKVMSLYSGGLNLKTSDSGGKVIRFNRFGDIRPIIYSDLIQIISVQYRFFTEGYCAILDKDVVKANSLDEYYVKFLDKKQIDNILNYDDSKITSLFKNTTKQIQQTIVDLILNNIVENKHVDKNKVSVISEVYGQDLYKLADHLKS